MSQQVSQFNIPDNTKNIVIFVHGFGVRWDSRGMFTDIQKLLPKTWGTILFDFYKSAGTDVYVTSMEEQVDRLTSIVKQAKEHEAKATVHIIAHSMGCVITSVANPEVDGKVIFLAPPELISTKTEGYFMSQPGAKSTKTEITVPRKDGTTTHIPLNFFTTMESINAEQAMFELGTKRPIYLLQTTDDEVIGRTQYNKLKSLRNAQITALAADHNFTGKYRGELLNYIDEVLL